MDVGDVGGCSVRKEDGKEALGGSGQYSQAEYREKIGEYGEAFEELTK